MKLSRILFALAILLLGNHCFAQWSWNPVSIDSAQYVQTFDFLTEDIGYAMMVTNQNGVHTLEKTTNGGTAWTQIPLPVMGQEFQALDFHADGEGVVVYRNLQNPTTPTKIYQTLDDGASWQDISPDTTATGLGNAVCQFIDADTGYFATDTYVYATVDGGANWATHSFNVYPMSISFHDSQNGTIGTFDGTFNYFGGMLSTTNGGQTWTQTDLTSTGTVIGKVGQLSPTVSYAAPALWGSYGQHQFYRSTNNGATWDTIAVPDTLPNSELTELDFKDEMYGVATVTKIGGVTNTYQTTDGGSTWAFVDSMSGLDVNDLLLVGTTGYLAGGELGVYYRMDLGMGVEAREAKSWKIFPNPVQSGQVVRWEGLGNMTGWSLSDVSGRVVQSGETTGNALALPMLQSGIYFLHFHGLEGAKYAKLIVE